MVCAYIRPTMLMHFFLINMQQGTPNAPRSRYGAQVKGGCQLALHMLMEDML